jgi:hypothetical protein
MDISFVVSQMIGLDAGRASADYIHLYHGNAALLAESLEIIQRTSPLSCGTSTSEHRPNSISPAPLGPARSQPLVHSVFRLFVASQIGEIFSDSGLLKRLDLGIKVEGLEIIHIYDGMLEVDDDRILCCL